MQSDSTFEDSAAMSATQMSAEDLHRDYLELAREKALLEKVRSFLKEPY